MSSNYRVLCLSHDPAILVDSDAEGSSYAVGAEIREEALHTTHAACDLVVGRYSYPLIEVRCFGSFHCFHSTPRDWPNITLALILSAYRLGGPISELAQKAARNCWPPTRLYRLSKEL